jgi:hypothetical protein
MFTPANSTSNYTFYQMGRIGADNDDLTQRNLFNDRTINYSLANYYNESTNNAQVDFATSQPNVMFNSVMGSGIGGGMVDIHSNLIYKHGNENTRSLEKLQLNQRPFLTIPYLGRGSCNPDIESSLRIGESVHGFKSVSTIMDKSFDEYRMFHIDSKMQDSISNPAIQELVYDGWNRGGANTREFDDTSFRNSRPNNKFF